MQGIRRAPRTKRKSFSRRVSSRPFQERRPPDRFERTARALANRVLPRLRQHRTAATRPPHLHEKSRYRSYHLRGCSTLGPPPLTANTGCSVRRALPDFGDRMSKLHVCKSTRSSRDYPLVALGGGGGPRYGRAKPLEWAHGNFTHSR